MASKVIIAHELGHLIMAILYEKEEYATSMQLVPDASTVACVNFEGWENLAVVDNNIARLKGNSYLGGIFGELAWYDRFNIWGIRCDLDEFLTENRYLGNEKHYRRSRAKIVNELFGWFYSDSDEWSFGGRSKLWFTCPRAVRGARLSSKRVKERLPITWKLYQKFLSCIDLAEFKTVVNEIHDKKSKIVPARSLRKYAKRIIPITVMHPEDI